MDLTWRYMSTVVISRVISPLRRVKSIVTLLITPLITTHEPPSRGRNSWDRVLIPPRGTFQETVSAGSGSLLQTVADCALFAPNCADCAGILPTAWHTANTTLWLSQPGCDLGFAACSFRAVPVVPAFCGSLLAAVPAVLRFLFNFQSER